MAKQKTFNVNSFKDKINAILVQPEKNFKPFINNVADYKSGLCAALEIILHESGNYNGFQFVNNNDSEMLTHGYFARKYY